MIKKPVLLAIIVLFLLSACSGGAPTPATTEPNPDGSYPGVGQPVDTGTYPGPEVPSSSIEYSAYPAPGQPSPYDPQSSDSNMQRADVNVDFANSDILLLDTSPIQAVLKIVVELPTPCHQVRVKVNEPDADKNIAVEVYALADTSAVCTQVISYAEARVSLGALNPGTYHVVINGATFKDFTID